MDRTLNLYMDESCHTQNDNTDTMSLVTVYTMKGNNKYYEIEIKKIKDRHKIGGELKWNKVSNSNVNFYKDLVSFFSEETKNNYLRIRALLININKKTIRSDYYIWYYKMVYLLFEKIIHDDLNINTKVKKVNLLLDYKDSNSHKETSKTAEFLQNKIHNKKRINGLAVNSKDHALIQFADIIAGALTYKKRKLETSDAKLDLINHIESEFSITLDKTTALTKLDFNLLVWTGSKR